MRQEQDPFGSDTQCPQLVGGVRRVGDVAIEAEHGPSPAERLEECAEPADHGARAVRGEFGVVHGEHETASTTQPVEGNAIEKRQHQPLKMDDVGILLGSQGLECAQAQGVLDALAQAAETGGLPAGLPLAGGAIEQFGEVERLARELLLVRAERPADHGDVDTERRQRPTEMIVIGWGEERRIDDENAHTASLRTVTRPPRRSLFGGKSHRQAGRSSSGRPDRDCATAHRDESLLPGERHCHSLAS